MAEDPTSQPATSQCVSLVFMALTPHRYQKSHSESKFPIFIKMFFLLGASCFWGMILVKNLGYSTRVLSLSVFL